MQDGESNVRQPKPCHRCTYMYIHVSMGGGKRSSRVRCCDLGTGGTYVSETLTRPPLSSHTYKQESWLHTYSARRGYLPTFTEVYIYVCMHRRNDHKLGQLVWDLRNSVSDASRKVNIKPSGGALWMLRTYCLARSGGVVESLVCVTVVLLIFSDRLLIYDTKNETSLV